MLRISPSCTAFVIALLVTSRAGAEPRGADAAVAESLFEEGRALLAKGRVSEACVKFAESQRIDPGGGTLLNLAFCHEREGKLATARSELEAAVSQAIKDNRHDREDLARAHLAAITPRLPRVTVQVAADDAELEVTLDGSRLPRASWGIATPVDPGSHVIDAMAPGKKDYLTRFEIAEAGAVNVRVPALERDPSSHGRTPTRPIATSDDSHWPVVHLEANDGDAVLEENRRVSSGAVVVVNNAAYVDDGTRWFPACRAPCDKPLDPQYTYRVTGSGITPSMPFTVEGQGRIELKANAGSSATNSLGAITTTIGILGVVTGGTCLLVGYLLPSDPTSGDHSGIKTVGWVGLGIGAPLVIGGILMGLASTTHVTRDGVRVAKDRPGTFVW